mgnify:CR=1 FL=1
MANLEGANLEGADLTRVNLAGANLTRADLEGAYLIRAYRSEERRVGKACRSRWTQSH